MNVGDLSESELIERIATRLPPSPAWLLEGIGDDAAVVEPERNRVEVLSVDALVEGVHFDRAFVPPDAIGHRALAVNLSDLAAMGAEPRAALVSLALPSALTTDAFDGMIDGLTKLAARHRLQIVGGNITRSPGPLVVDITVTGTAKKRQVLRRRGARPGDGLYVSGSIGLARAGLLSLQSPVFSPQSAGDRRLGTGDSAVERYLRPEPRVRLGLALGRTRTASACIDLSDGLADGVHRLAAAGDVGFIVETSRLPIDAAVCSEFKRRGLDPVREAIAGGDDYELLFTVPARRDRRLAAAARIGGVPLTRIGTCVKERGAQLRSDGAAADSPLPDSGFRHFR